MHSNSLVKKPIETNNWDVETYVPIKTSEKYLKHEYSFTLPLFWKKHERTAQNLLKKLKFYLLLNFYED